MYMYNLFFHLSGMLSPSFTPLSPLSPYHSFWKIPNPKKPCFSCSAVSPSSFQVTLWKHSLPPSNNATFIQSKSFHMFNGLVTKKRNSPTKFPIFRKRKPPQIGLQKLRILANIQESYLNMISYGTLSTKQ